MRVSTFAAGVVVLGWTAGSAFGVTAFSHDFESAGGYTTSVPEFSDGFGDFWHRDDGTNEGSFIEYSGVGGSYYFAGMDIDGEGAVPPLVQTFSGISITGLTSLQFSADLAEDDDGTNQDWDLASDLSGNPDDLVSFEYQIDGGGYLSIYDVFGQNPTSTNGYSNGEPQVGGVAVTNTFATFSAALAGTGNSLDIRITWDLNAGDEDLAIDNLLVTGVPTPATAALLGLGGLVGMRRRRA